MSTCGRILVGKQPIPPSTSEDAPSAEVIAVLMRAVPGIRAILLRMTNDPAAIDDLTQEVLISVWQSMQARRIRDLHSLPAYALQCTRHLAMAHSRKPRPESLAIDEEKDAESEWLWTDRPMTPLERVEGNDLWRLALQVLQELHSERDRALILGFFVEGRSKAELTVSLGLNPDAFDKVLSRARHRMRELLHEKLNGSQQGVRGSAPETLSADQSQGDER